MRWILLWAFILFLIPYSTYPLNIRWFAVASLVREHHFDYLGWELGAIAAKTTETLWGVHPYADDSQRAEWVRTYFADLATAQALDRQIDALYIDPSVTDPQAATADLRAERDALRADLRERQGRVEASLEGQVAAVLVDEGFGILGQLIPPISMHFSQAPNVLIISPRDEIRTELTMSLNPLSTDQKAALEAEIDTRENVSSLILPIGGIALFPAMIQETSNLTWAVETFSHEWFHHYMFLYPLGLSYDYGEATTINETAADIFGKEIAAKVLARYYPELVEVRGTQYVLPHPPTPSPYTERGSETVQPLISPNTLLLSTRHSALSTALQFDFNAEMRETRVTVDALLAEGKIDEAETYMEDRRAFFFENGYALRKLNQAYFAFFGDYQGGGFAGAGGEDPIGPAVRETRTLSPTLLDFALNLRSVTDLAGLTETLERLRLERDEKQPEA